MKNLYYKFQLTKFYYCYRILKLWIKKITWKILIILSMIPGAIILFFQEATLEIKNLIQYELPNYRSFEEFKKAIKEDQK